MKTTNLSGTTLKTRGFKSLWEERGDHPLTPHQHKILDSVVDARKGKKNYQAVIKGAAGTGKTTLIKALVVALESQDVRVQVSAPTHKAVAVLKDKILPMSSRFGIDFLEPKTIHSVLGLSPKVGIPGEPEKFVKRSPANFNGAPVLIVDECSMIGADLFEEIQKEVEKSEVHVIYVGDSSQLKPVNERTNSHTFTLDECYSLKEVLRHDGAILDKATEIRMTTDGKPPSFEDQRGETSLIKTYESMQDLEDAWLEDLKRRHRSGTDTSSVVMLCWTNKERRDANRKAREAIHGKSVPPFMVGDRIMTLEPVNVRGKLLIPNNADLDIVNVYHSSCFQPYKTSKETYRCFHITTSDYGIITVLDEDDRSKFKKHLKSISKDIKAYGEKLRAEPTPGTLSEKAKHEAKIDRTIRKMWRTEYFALKEAFAEVDFSYSLTIHKSQGSTYDVVYINQDYLDSRAELKQLIYVAVTRAAKEVHHVRTV